MDEQIRPLLPQLDRARRGVRAYAIYRGVSIADADAIAKAVGDISVQEAYDAIDQWPYLDPAVLAQGED